MKPLVAGIFICTAVLSGSFAAPSGQPQRTNNVRFLSVVEESIIQEMNAVRQQPKEYAALLESLRPYFNGKLLELPGQPALQTQEGLAALDEAVKVLRSTRPMTPLQPSKGLSLAARDLVRDQERSGRTGHVASDRSQVAERASRYGNWRGRIAENISYGPSDPRQIVLALLIDDGVPNRGHRKTLLTPDFNNSGVAIGKHNTFGTMCVITYAAGYSDSK